MNEIYSKQLNFHVAQCFVFKFSNYLIHILS